ncbi:hypothetical protein RAC89_05090 [Paenibacillus sp. GD4]|jgi:drug/metabolite transporter (DMT)-like permease|uniref:hypothetical protein n=1 Tax=Paenibacillus sp. GD4 TaxID=3068890 RepID=UPI0027967A1B|nr:hypothetical protein [Paenibacillus sp. GD4]MDQ1909881.1 hypothetical protein [Paenibacillus sp. GD4]
MSKEKMNKWGQTRRMGKAKYVMYYGVLLWGVSFTILTTAVEWMTQQSFTGSWLTIRLLVFSVLGFFIANFGWERKEKQWISSQPKPAKKQH